MRIAYKKIKAKNSICPHCNIKMKSENGDNEGIIEFWLECKKCGRSYDENGKDITDYSCTDIYEEIKCII